MSPSHLHDRLTAAFQNDEQLTPRIKGSTFLGKEIRNTSKQEESAVRDDLAKDILSKRANYFGEKRLLLNKIRELEDTIQHPQDSHENLLTQLLEKNEKKRTRKNSLTHNLLQRIRFLGEDRTLARLVAESEEITVSRIGISLEIGKLERKLAEAQESLKEEKRKLDEETKASLDIFYQERLFNFLTSEKKEQLFTEDNLSSMDLDEYLELWRAGSPHFVAHVTRQGFRDHNAMIYHSAGMGEYVGGFATLLEDDKLLRSPFGVEGLTEISREDVLAFLKRRSVLEQPTLQESLDLFERVMNFSWGSAPHYPDKTAIHFSAQRVLDDYYGGEQGNEVFYIFPADFIASQSTFAFNGAEKDFTRPQSEHKWNDIFVWPKGKNTISLDAGIVFLPASTMVDPDTGSKYASTQTEGGRNRVERRDIFDVFQSWWSENVDVFREAHTKVQKASHSMRHYIRDDFMVLITEKLKDLGNTDGVWSGQVHTDIAYYFELNIDFTKDEDKLRSFLDNARVLYDKPEQSVTSKEYWEGRFSANPGEKPRHVVYYDGDPNVAVTAFMKEQGISSRKESRQLLDFDKNHIPTHEDMENDPRANVGKEELILIARQIIAEHYQGEVSIGAFRNLPSP